MEDSVSQILSFNDDMEIYTKLGYQSDAFLSSKELLKHSSAKGHLEIVKCLIQNGTRGKNKALARAIECNQFEIVKYLVQTKDGEKINLVDAVVQCLISNRSNMLYYLLEKATPKRKRLLNRSKYWNNLKYYVN